MGGGHDHDAEALALSPWRVIRDLEDRFGKLTDAQLKKMMAELVEGVRENAKRLGSVDAAYLRALEEIVLAHATVIRIHMIGRTSAGVTPMEAAALMASGRLDPLIGLDPIGEAYAFGALQRTLEDAGLNTAVARLPTFEEAWRLAGPDPIPGLSRLTELSAAHARSSAGIHCKALGNRMGGEILSATNLEDLALRDQMRAIIRDQTALAVEQGKGAAVLARELASLTGNYARDWRRIAATELHKAREYGMADAIELDFGPDTKVIKRCEPDACERCKELYQHPDGTPRVFLLSELRANGENVGRKRKDFAPTLGPAHPWCLPPGQPVTTARGSVPIEDVTVGDYVVTHRGRWRRVTQTFRHYYSGPIAEVALEDGRMLLSTPEHQWLTARGKWDRADALRNGVEVRGGLVLGHSDADYSPSESGQVGRLAHIYFCLSRSGMPITTVDFDSYKARFVGEVDQESANHFVVGYIYPEGSQGVCGDDLILRGRASGPGADCGNDLGIGPLSPSDGIMGSGTQSLALRGGGLLHADVHGFASSPLCDPGFFENADDAEPRHTELGGYRLYGEILCEVEGLDLLCVKRNFPGLDIDPHLSEPCGKSPALDPNIGGNAHEFFAAFVAKPRGLLVENYPSASHVSPRENLNENMTHHTAAVKYVALARWSGYVYNLGVDEDESYVVNGVATHNCRCWVEVVRDDQKPEKGPA